MMRFMILLLSLLFLISLMPSCNRMNSTEKKVNWWDPKDGSAFSKIERGMIDGQVQQLFWSEEHLFGQEGKKIAPTKGWPRKMKEVAAKDGVWTDFPDDEIRYFYWATNDKHKWVAVGFGLCMDVSLTGPLAVVKYSGLDGSEAPK